MKRLLPLLLLMLATPAQGIDPRYDAPAGHYSAAGNYTQLNPPDLLPKGPTGAELRKGIQHAPPAPGESPGNLAIRLTRVPVAALPPLAEEYSTSPDPADQRGRLGWGEKLSGASDLAVLGADVAFATMANLFVPYFQNLLVGSMPPGNPAAYAAAQQIREEMDRQIATSDVFLEFRQRFYEPGAKLLAENYDSPTVSSVSGSPPRNDGTVNPRSVSYDPNDIVSRLDAKTIAALEAAGIDVTQVVSGILSGTFDAQAFDATFAPKGALTTAQAESAKEIADAALRSAGITPGESERLAEGGGDAKTRAGTSEDKAKAGAEAKEAALTALPPGFERGTRRAEMSSREALKAHLEKLLNERRALRARSVPVQKELRGDGILAVQPGRNIFQIAHRTYRSFRKWKAPLRYASQPANIY